jgi:multidrug efflux pump subunit AcrA (membrane-fusion protein)
LGIKNAAKLVPLKDDIKPMDPVTENARALKGEPVKAFLHQDHTAHIAVHNAMMQDPMIQQKIGQNPRAQQIMAALQDHITEHVAFEYRQQIESQLGLPLPPPDEELPPEAENALSAMMAQAGQQQLQESQQQAQQQQAQQQAQDPVLQMQQQELQIKQQQVQIEQQKAQTDMQKSMQELEFRREQMERELQLKQEQMERDYELKREQMERDYEFKREQMEATSLREGLKMGLAKEKDDATHMREGMRLGLEKDREDANQTREGLKLGMSYNAPAKEAPQKSKQPPDKKE